MTTIVRHKRTGNEYILLGINGEENKVNPSRFISELFAQEKSEVSYSATVCDVQGNLFLAYIDDLIVVEIDGKKPADLLPEPISPPETQPTAHQPYPQSESEFDDRELEEEDEQFDDEEFDESDRQPVADVASSTPSNQSELDEEEDEDWI